MALRAAIANGNWSNPAIWNGGVLPAPGDVVASNGFTVTIDQNITVDTLSNTVQTPVIITPAMTSNTTPSGIVSASSSLGALYDSWKAFDRVEAASEWLTSGATTGWLAYEFPTARAVGRYVLVPPANQSPTSIPRDWTFEGWNGSTWVILDTVTGNSGTANVTRTLANTTAYIRYRINITLNNGSGSYTGIRELYLYETNEYTINSVAGGGFVLNSGVTANLTGTNSITQGSTTVLTVPVTTGNTSTLIANNLVRANVAQHLIVLSGAGTFNVTGNIPVGGGNSLAGINITGVNSTLNFTGTINGGQGPAAHGINTDVVCTINVVGSIFGGSSSNLAAGLRFNSAGVFTLVGTVSGGFYGFNNGVYLNNTTATITGDIYGGNIVGADSPGVRADNNVSITVIGTMYGRVSPALISTSNIYLNHYGSIISTGLNGGGGSQSNVGLSSTGSGAINLLTGPFVSSPTGILPLYVTRMHYRRTLGSYYEFRDNSTNGALPPAAAAPAIRMNSPEVGSDLPVVANVRSGTVYGAGSFTGTMVVPAASNVRLGVAVDNTVGTGAITAQDVWNVLTSGMNTTGSIGARLKNASTVDTTGNQLAAYL